MDLVSLMEHMSLTNNEEPITAGDFKISKAIIDGAQTEIAYCEFTNQLFLIITQFGRAGSCMRIAKDQLQTDFGVEFVYSVHQIFGNITLEQEATARYLAECLDIKKPLLIFINLLKYNKELVNELSGELKKLVC